MLYLSGNQLSGSLPTSLCNLNIDWSGTNNWGVEYYNINGNEICPPYPSCMDTGILGDQNCIELLGDLNDDGSLNVLDIVIIANIILDSTNNLFEADINQDGVVNILDLVNLITLILDE